LPGGGWEDATGEMGLVEPLTGMRVHAAAWGDVDGDGRVDLVVGTFGDRPPDDYRVRGADGPRPDRIIYGGDPPRIVDLGDRLGRTSGAVLADLDGDVDLDLVLIRNAGLSDQSDLPSQVFANLDGRLEFASDLPLPSGYQGRSVVAFPLDGDVDLDLAVIEDRYGETGLRVLRNQGDLRFVDVTERVGVPEGVHGLGVAAVDLTGDGWVELVVGGDPRVLVGGQDRFDVEVVPELGWEEVDPEDLAGGVAVGDVDGDGSPDLAVGHHFGRAGPDDPIPVRLYLNRSRGQEPAFREVELEPLPVKAPHVEIVDVDADGRMDVVTSASDRTRTEPVVYLNRGDLEFVPSAEPGDHYWVTAPTADVDGDGSRDLFGGEWDPGVPSRLLLNRLTAGNSLRVDLPAPGRGVGGTVEVWDAGDGSRLATIPVVAGVGYAASSEPAVHVGLGTATRAEVTVSAPGYSGRFAAECRSGNPR
jgi:hypothetical protein